MYRRKQLYYCLYHFLRGNKILQTHTEHSTDCTLEQQVLLSLISACWDLTAASRIATWIKQYAQRSAQKLMFVGAPKAEGREHQCCVAASLC